ncbi:hypothetical protein F383_27617 [Gossypium arboreum]|uniref:Uncharacterized protein n=1 Tax=Gossypium arboreum TaxID=29729 RepID=A0A0B0MYF2_GOSAR|nr:hypothetical protein F383_27617 [Gossypium arboreum]
MLVQDTTPRIPYQHIFLIVGTGWKLLEPFLGDVDLAFGGASINLLEPVRRRIDQPDVSQGPK